MTTPEALAATLAEAKRQVHQLTWLASADNALEATQIGLRVSAAIDALAAAQPATREQGQGVPKWCSYCRSATHSDAECTCTRIEGWKPGAPISTACLQDLTRQPSAAPAQISDERIHELWVEVIANRQGDIRQFARALLAEAAPAPAASPVTTLEQAVAAQRQPIVPEGWKLVPDWPTDAMVDAGVKKLGWSLSECSRSRLQAALMSALDATPSPRDCDSLTPPAVSEESERDTCVAIDPPEFPNRPLPFTDTMSADELWDYGCLTGWRAAHLRAPQAAEEAWCRGADIPPQDCRVCNGGKAQCLEAPAQDARRPPTSASQEAKE